MHRVPLKPMLERCEETQSSGWEVGLSRPGAHVGGSGIGNSALHLTGTLSQAVCTRIAHALQWPGKNKRGCAGRSAKVNRFFCRSSFMFAGSAGATRKKEKRCLSNNPITGRSAQRAIAPRKCASRRNCRSARKNPPSAKRCEKQRPTPILNPGPCPSLRRTEAKSCDAAPQSIAKQ